jgi:hypothetical protein
MYPRTMTTHSFLAPHDPPAGVGLVVPTLLGRLEANYVWVLTAREGDRLRQGFSFGFASNMGL